MKLLRIITVVLCWTLAGGISSGYGQKQRSMRCEYVILVGQSVETDLSWKKLVDYLKLIHDGKVFTYKEAPGETFDQLRQAQPRYVAVVEKPEHITVEFVRTLHIMSRNMDNDPYGDFLWGIITGNYAAAAMKTVQEAETARKVDEAWVKSARLEQLEGFEGKSFCSLPYGEEWKELMMSPGRPSMSEVVSLSQQRLLERRKEWKAESLTVKLPNGYDGTTSIETMQAFAAEQLGVRCTPEQADLLRNRDAIAYYGDPKRDLRMAASNSQPYLVTFKKKRLECLVTLLASGNEEVKVDELVYCFPKRLEEPQLLTEMQAGEQLLFDENFMILRNVTLKPGEKYTITFSVQGADSVGIKVLKIIQSRGVDF